MAEITPERWEEIQSLFHRTLDEPADRRKEFLDANTAADATLRLQVERLLAADGKPAQLFDVPFEEMADMLAPTADDEQRFGPYRIKKRIGSGGMGEVFLAHDERLGRDLALKLLPAHLVEDGDASERLRDEARAASALDHPNICTIFDIGESKDGRTFIAMAYYPGESLQERLRRDRPSDEEAVRIAIQVLEALSAAHARGIVHRDIKPGNVLLAELQADGGSVTVKLLDFGLAKVSRPDRPQASATFGTAPYMSPEQAAGQSVDYRADLWAVGVMLYEMIAGVRPFEGDDSLAVIHSILHTEPIPIKTHRADLADALAGVVAKVLAGDINERYARATDLIADLERIIRPEESPAAIRRRRIRSYTAAAAVLLILFVASLGLSRLVQSSRNLAEAGANPTVGVLPFRSVDSPTGYDAVSDGITEELIAGLVGFGLEVPSVSSAMKLKGSASDAAGAAASLQFNEVIGGSARRVGDVLAVSAQLVRSSDGDTLWAGTFEAPLNVARDGREDVAAAILSEVLPRFTRSSAFKVAARPDDSDAYLLYFKGHYFANKRTKAGLERSVEFFRQALDLDPTYAAAWAGLGASYVLLGNWGIMPASEAYPIARAAAETAIGLDPNLAEAHTVLAFAYKDYYWDWALADEQFTTAISLEPSSASAHHQYALEFLSVMGRQQEALREVRLAASIDPLSLMIATDVGRALYMAGEPASAIDQLSKVLERDSTFFPARLFLGIAQIQAGRTEDAVATLRQAVEQSKDDIGPSPNAMAYFTLALAKAGRDAEARETVSSLEALAQKRPVLSYWLAVAHSAVGETDNAFTYLERAYQEKDPVLIYLKAHPLMRDLRRDSRAKALLERMGLG